MGERTEEKRQSVCLEMGTMSICDLLSTTSLFDGPVVGLGVCPVPHTPTAPFLVDFLFPLEISTMLTHGLRC